MNNENQNEEKQERILPVFIEDEVQKSYLDYSMSMITSRALPDVRDGLKPVHRRVLFGMEELGLQHNKPPKKSARVVGDVIGKYHPHGDTAVYDTVVRMAQDFSLRYPMVNGQGNFGSIDGDNPAAMRYTECRMTVFAEEMLADLDKDTVDFAPNYDDSLKEPTVLPSKLPFILLNGSTGIAVGMTTNMAPHNLREVCDGLVAIIDNPDITVDDLIKIIPGPDFPTGGIVFGRHGIHEAYRTGKGKVIMRAKAEVQKLPGGREEIIITEIPYMVNKGVLLKNMDELRIKGEGISFVRDESDRRGMRIVVGIKRDAFGDVILNQLYKYTSLQETFGIINLALVNMRPRLLPLKELMCHFLDHRHDVVVRRTEFDLRKARDRAHILEGLRIALDHIDEIVALIRGSASPDEAHRKLMERFGLSEIQAKAILDMRLQRLTGLERDKIEQEYGELLLLIDDLNDILAKRERRMKIIRDELVLMKERYGDPRRTEITDAASDIDIEDMIADEDMVITMSHEGYIKRTAMSEYRAQGRGGRGVKGMDSKENDFIETLFVASAHSYILFFTNTGRCYRIKVYKIPEASRSSRGRPIVNVIDLMPGEKIAAFVPVREFDDAHFIVSATEKGKVIRQRLSKFAKAPRRGIYAQRLFEGDSLIEVKLTTGGDDVILGTALGRAARFSVGSIRPMGRNAGGVRGARLRDGDKIVSMVIANDQDDILTVTDNGFGKRTPVEEYRRAHRGGLGIKNIKLTDKSGKSAVSLKRVRGDEDIMLITKNGIIIRMNVDLVRLIYTRNSQGVRLINLDDDDSVIDVAICDRDSSDENEASGIITQAAPVETVPEDLEDAAIDDDGDDDAIDGEDVAADDEDGGDEADEDSDDDDVDDENNNN